jgi:hypothetical protein
MQMDLKVLKFYLDNQYEHFQLIVQDYEEYEVVNVQKMYPYV